MRLALISDIHGNTVALHAVIADANACGVDAWWVLGDLVAIGPSPCETLEILTQLPNVKVLSGNTERYVLTRDRPFPHAADVLANTDLLDLYTAVHGSFIWTRGALASRGWLTWLAALPRQLRTTLSDGTRVLGVHASPLADDDAGITPQRHEHELALAFEGAGADVVIGGHTHQPTDRTIGDVRAINLGSVSNPITDDLRASYAILDDSSQNGYVFEHRRVAYDHEAFLELVVSSSHPEADYIASFQRGEQVRFRTTASSS